MKEWNGFKRGINLGGWLSQCDYSLEHIMNFIGEDDIKQIASWGLDHVRLPIDFNVLEMEGVGYERVDETVAWCEKYGLNLIIDIHKTKGFSFDAGENESGFFDSEPLQEYFYSLWETIAKRYGDKPDRIVFELLNEVTEQKFIGAWNRIIYECIGRIRKYAPDTTVIVGSYQNNSAATVHELFAPYDDKVVFTFHCYDPLKFTHQGAYWVPPELLDPAARMTYEESGVNKEFFINFFASALEKAKECDTLLYCGEYGVIDVVPPEEAIKWLRDIHEVFEMYGIGRCLWSYKKMDYGFTDERLDGLRDEYLKLL